MKKWLETSFIISLVLFLLAGSLLVIGQIAGILMQNGELIKKVMRFSPSQHFC
ncbi:hypothetical protein [Brevibacillus panacihumi]|uniref:hypothetical protein n=1 Tax=Brevibacillus panacihumi TaxID=497735 RepID=UPI003D24D8B6